MPKKQNALLTPEQYLNETYCSGLFKTLDGTYFDFVNDNVTLSANSYWNVLDWLQGRVAGLQVHNFRGIKVPFVRNTPATIFVDEMRMDASYLNMLPVADIAMIKVIKSPFVGAPGANSTIAIYTKRGEEAEVA